MRTAPRLCCLCIRAYQTLRAGYPPVCRYVPSCSNYALEAVENHGFIRGIGLTVRRICRCHPWGGSGWDPVPLTGNSQAVSKESAGV